MCNTVNEYLNCDAVDVVDAVDQSIYRASSVIFIPSIFLSVFAFRVLLGDGRGFELFACLSRVGGMLFRVSGWPGTITVTRVGPALGHAFYSYF